MTTHSFWQNKKVFLTGHTGFKGSWLGLWLQTLGAKVSGYSLQPLPTDFNLFNFIGLDHTIRSYEGDVRDFNYLQQVLRDEKPDIVFHLAAQPLVRQSYKDPLETFSTNIMGTANLLEALRQIDSAAVAIIVTSDKCYDNRNQRKEGHQEDGAMGGHDPYSSSKGCAELITAAYWNSFFNVAGPSSTFIASVRAGNVIGGGDWAADRLIPDCVRAIAQKQPILIRCPEAVRPWQHVLEPLSGYLLLAETLWEQGKAFAGGWNFGPLATDAKTVSWIVSHLTELWGNGARWALDSREHPFEAHYLQLDITKSQRELGWRPRWDIATALAQTVAWYQSYHDRDATHALMLKQIDHYQRSTVI